MATEQEGHTPGPWRVDPSYAADVQSGDGALEIACTHPEILTDGKAPGFEECCANARLIAAAPDLLEALQYLVLLGGGDCLEPARAAIARATGEA